MVLGMPPVGITQNERFLSCDNILLEVQYVGRARRFSPVVGAKFTQHYNFTLSPN